MTRARVHHFEPWPAIRIAARGRPATAPPTLARPAAAARSSAARWSRRTAIAPAIQRASLPLLAPAARTVPRASSARRSSHWRAVLRPVPPRPAAPLRSAPPPREPRALERDLHREIPPQQPARSPLLVPARPASGAEPPKAPCPGRAHSSLPRVNFDRQCSFVAVRNLPGPAPNPLGGRCDSQRFASVCHR